MLVGTLSRRSLFAHKKSFPIGRKEIQKTFLLGYKQKSPTILLPPYCTLQELRLMLRIDYATCFKHFGVAYRFGKYTWRDPSGRLFETGNKVNVTVPFTSAVSLCTKFNLKPIMVSPEPIYGGRMSGRNRGKNGEDEDSPRVPKRSDSICPVIALFGPSNHGKTAVINRFTGLESEKLEAGGITQNVCAVTVEFQEVAERIGLSGDESSVLPFNSKITFVDTPGHEMLGLMRDRASSIADVGIFLLSVVDEASERLKELLIQAANFDIPFVFAFNKSDHFLANIDLAKAELLKLSTELLDSGLMKRDFSDEIRVGIPISSLQRDGISDLLRHSVILAIKSSMQDSSGTVSEIPSFASSRPNSSLTSPHSLERYRGILRRSDLLVDAEDCATPPGVATVVDITKNENRGTLLKLVVRHGRVEAGTYFVAGSEYGQISGVYSSEDCKNLVEIGTAGMAIVVSGSKAGDMRISVSDVLLILPQKRAFRLAKYRERVMNLKAMQIEGPELDVEEATESKTNKGNQPQDLSGEKANSKNFNFEAGKDTSIYIKPSTFLMKSQEELHPDAEEIIHPKEKSSSREFYHAFTPGDLKELKTTYSPDSSVYNRDIVENYEILQPLQASEKVVYEAKKASDLPVDIVETVGNSIKSLETNILHPLSQPRESMKSSISDSFDLRFSPDISRGIQDSGCINESGGSNSEKLASRGRKSMKFREKLKGKSVGSTPPHSYYLPADIGQETGDLSWEDKIDYKNSLRFAYWKKREEEKEMKLMKKAKSEVLEGFKKEKIRKGVFCEDSELSEANRELLFSAESAVREQRKQQISHNNLFVQETAEDSAREHSSRTDIPLVLRASHAGLFDTLMQALEELETAYNVRISVVHGGIGPIIPSDVTHAEIEQQFTSCPVYAFHVSVLPEAIKQAVVKKITIKRFDVFSDFLDDLEQRCKALKQKSEESSYLRCLKKYPTKSGL